MMYDIKEAFYKLHKYPVVLAINQKSSSFDKRDDESVLGGLGIVHDVDGSIVIRSEIVDQWKNKQLGLPQGTKIRFIRIEDIRMAQADTTEHLYVMEKDPKTGALELKIGETIEKLKSIVNKDG